MRPKIRLPQSRHPQQAPKAGKGSDIPRHKPASGTILVLALTVGAMIAALLALKFRVLEPRLPTTQPTTTTSVSSLVPSPPVLRGRGLG